jgi:hypothetical protein
MTDQLLQLHSLHNQSVLTDEEFAQAKRQVLAPEQISAGQVPLGLPIHMLTDRPQGPAWSPRSRFEELPPSPGPRPGASAADASAEQTYTTHGNPAEVPEKLGALFKKLTPAAKPLEEVSGTGGVSPRDSSLQRVTVEEPADISIDVAECESQVMTWLEAIVHNTSNHCLWFLGIF